MYLYNPQGVVNFKYKYKQQIKGNIETLLARQARRGTATAVVDSAYLYLDF